MRWNGETSVTRVEYDTDAADVDRLYAAAKRRFRDGLADKYWAYRVTESNDTSYEAKILTFALSTKPDVVDKVEAEAADRVRQWLDSHGAAIALLSEDKKAKYAEVRAMAREPEQVTPGLPTAVTMPGDPSVDAYERHLYADSAAVFRVRLKGSWEKYVLVVESAIPGFVAWYRNPTGGQRALRIPYDTGSGYGKLYPDFIVLHEDDAGTLRPSIIDPHGHHLSDAADKLRGSPCTRKSTVRRMPASSASSGTPRVSSGCSTSKTRRSEPHSPACGPRTTSRLCSRSTARRTHRRPARSAHRYGHGHAASRVRGRRGEGASWP